MEALAGKDLHASSFMHVVKYNSVYCGALRWLLVMEPLTVNVF